MVVLYSRGDSGDRQGPSLRRHRETQIHRIHSRYVGTSIRNANQLNIMEHEAYA